VSGQDAPAPAPRPAIWIKNWLSLDAPAPAFENQAVFLIFEPRPL